LHLKKLVLSLYAMNTIEFPQETRGRNRKYDFEGMNKNDVRKFGGVTTANILYCATNWAKTKKIKAKFSARKENGYVFLMRIK
jgi:hypothetical protein